MIRCSLSLTFAALSLSFGHFDIRWLVWLSFVCSEKFGWRDSLCVAVYSCDNCLTGQWSHLLTRLRNKNENNCCCGLRDAFHRRTRVKCIIFQSWQQLKGGSLRTHSPSKQKSPLHIDMYVNSDRSPNCPSIVCVCAKCSMRAQTMGANQSTKAPSYI